MRDKWPPLPFHGAEGNGSTTVLVAHDRVDVRDQAAALLRDEGYRVLLSNDGDEILRLVREDRLDMILIDVEVLNRHGFVLQERIREIEPSLPIVHTSSSKHYRPL